MIFPLFILAIADDEDRTFMETLYRENYRLMYATALKFFSDKHDIEDVVESSCEALYQKIRLLQSLDRARQQGYIVSTVRHKAQNMHKHIARSRSHVTELPDEIENVASDQKDLPEERIILSEDIAVMKRAILSLSEKERAALSMKFLMEQSDYEIAASIGMAPGSVRQIIKRARDKLKRIVSMEGCDL